MHNKRLLRVNKSETVCCLLGGAVKADFVTGLYKNGRMMHKVKIWYSCTKGKKSNLREADNLVTKVGERVREEILQLLEVFMVTDNMVFESRFYK